MHRTRIVLATVLIALTGAAQAQGKIFVGPENGIATSPTDVIGISSSEDGSECTNPDGTTGNYQVAASHDRGATWTAGACGNMTPLMLDPVSGAVSTLMSSQHYDPATGSGVSELYLTTLDREGKVAGGRQVADPDPRTSKLAAVDGGTLFMAVQSESERITSMHSVGPSGAEGACQVPPGVVEQLLAMPNGVLLALNNSNPDELLVAISNDGCKTWTKTPDKPGAKF